MLDRVWFDPQHIEWFVNSYPYVALSEKISLLKRNNIREGPLGCGDKLQVLDKQQSNKLPK